MERQSGFDPINIAVGKPCTVREIIACLLQLDGYRDAVVKYDSSKPTMIPKRLIDTSKASEQLGFHAHTSITDGLRKTIDWYRKNKI
jgi:GDP-L-fucose synthase